MKLKRSICAILIFSIFFYLPAAKTPAGEMDHRDSKMQLIQARILTQQGKYPEALAIMHQLKARHPDDQAIAIYYIDVLINTSNYDQAQREIDTWLRDQPDHPIANRYHAALLGQTKQYEAAITTYQKILRQYNADPQLWLDYGFTCLNSGDWITAYDAFNRIVDAPLAHDTASEQCLLILKAHRPRLNSHYTHFTSKADRGSLTQYGGDYSSHITQNARLSFKYGTYAIRRETGASQIDQTIDELALGSLIHLSPKLEIAGGINAFSGITDHLGGYTDVRFSHRSMITKFQLNLNSFWHDPYEAVLEDGFYHSARLVWEKTFDDEWEVGLSGKRYRYYIREDDYYGHRNQFQVMLKKHFCLIPRLTLDYNVTHSVFKYNNFTIRPVPMTTFKTSHRVAGILRLPLFQHVTLVATGGYEGGRYEIITRHSLNTLFHSTKVEVELGQRLSGDIGYMFASESENNTGGGETENVEMNLRILF